MRYAGKIHCLSEASLNFSGMVLANFRKLSIPASAAVSENKYFPALYNGFTGRREREGIGDRGKDEMYGCRNGRLQDLVGVCYSKGN